MALPRATPKATERERGRGRHPLFQSENMTRTASRGAWPGQPHRPYTPETALSPTLCSFHPDILKTQGTGGGPCMSTLLPQGPGSRERRPV